MKSGYAQLCERDCNERNHKAGLGNSFKRQSGQFIKFGLVGVSNTIVFWVIAVLVTYFFHEKFEKSYVIGNILAFLISVAWSFFWNRCLVFKDKNRGWKLVMALYKFYIAYAFTGILLNNILSWIWIEKLGLIYFIAPLLNSVIGFPVNFIINKMWTFSETN